MAINKLYVALAKRINQRMVSAEAAAAKSTVYQDIQSELIAAGISSKKGVVRFPERIARLDDAQVDKLYSIAQKYSDVKVLRAKDVQAPQKRPLSMVEKKYQKYAKILNNKLRNTEQVGATSTIIYRKAVELAKKLGGSTRFPENPRAIKNGLHITLNEMIAYADDPRLGLKKSDMTKMQEYYSSGERQEKKVNISGGRLYSIFYRNLQRWEENNGTIYFGYYYDKTGKEIFDESLREQQLQETAMACAFWAEMKRSSGGAPDIYAVINGVLDMYREGSEEKDVSSIIKNRMEEWAKGTDELHEQYGTFYDYLYNTELKN